MMKKATHIVVHYHDYGTSVNLVRYTGKRKWGPTEDEVIAACEIDFEEYKGETIDIFPIEDGEEVVEIK